MERNGRLRCALLIILLVLSLLGCSEGTGGIFERRTVQVIFETGKLTAKSSDPDEDKISDINLLVFDTYGRVEEHVFIKESTENRYELELMMDKDYRFVACVNFGYRIRVEKMEDLENLEFHLAYPDEYRDGIPMYADSGFIPSDKIGSVSLKLIRLMSKISIKIDRRRLSDGVEINIAGVRIGNCPKSTVIFSPNKVESADECFTSGFSKTGEECSALNINESKGISHSINLFMLENLQGRFAPEPLENDSEKVLADNDPRKETCSFIEIDIDYISPEKISSNGFLKYRFYLGGGRDDMNIERNCHYTITICPEDDGLKGNGWRVDKSAIHPISPPSFSYYPDGYIRGNIGDIVHIGCIFTPSDAPFDVGLEYLEYDKSEGIYDYAIDADGHGATLTLTGPGRGLVYMSAGPPVNGSALWIIEVNLPSV